MKAKQMLLTSMVGIVGLLAADNGNEVKQQTVTPVSWELRPRLPEWRPTIVERFPEGNPALVLFLKREKWKKSSLTMIKGFCMVSKKKTRLCEVLRAYL